MEKLKILEESLKEYDEKVNELIIIEDEIINIEVK